MPPPIIILLPSLSYHISDTKVQICYLQLLLHYQGCATCAYTSLSRNAIFKSQSCVIMENSQRLLSTKKKMENIKDGSYWAIMRCFVITTNISNKSNTSKCQRFHLYPKAPINLIYIYIVRTGFEFLAQKIDGLKPKKPKTMNLQRAGWKTELK